MRNLTFAFVLVFSALSLPASAAQTAVCATPQHRALDFLLGTWIAKAPNGHATGKAQVSSILGGCTLRLHWIGTAYEGYADHTYDESRLEWRKAWSDSNGGVELGRGRFKGTTLLYVGYDYEQGRLVGMHRQTLRPLSHNSVEFLLETSADGGRTWSVATKMTYYRVSWSQFEAARLGTNRAGARK